MKPIEMTFDEIRAKFRVRGGAQVGLIQRLLRGEPLAKKDCGTRPGALYEAVRTLTEHGYRFEVEDYWTDDQLAALAMKGLPGRKNKRYTLVGKVKKVKAEVVPAERAELEPVAPKRKPRMAHLPPLPDFGQGLITTGIMLKDDDTGVEVHLRNGQGTFVAEIVGYRALPVS